MIKRVSPKNVCCGFMVFLVFLPLITKSSYILHILIFSFINVVCASSLRFINLTGQLSLAHGGMMAIGAYATTLLVMKKAWNSWISLMAGGGLAAGVALLISVPFSRLRGVYFSIASLFFTAIVYTIAQQWRSLTGGSLGLYNIPLPHRLGIGKVSLAIDTPIEFYYFALSLFVLSLLFLFRLEHSWFGFICRSIRQSESLAQSLGVPSRFYRCTAFVLGSFLPAIMGGFYAQYMSTITPHAFGLLTTFYYLIYVIVGGQEHFFGPVIGAFALTLLPEFARPLKQWQPLVFAIVLMLVIYYKPGGLIEFAKAKRTKRQVIRTDVSNT